MVLVGCIGVWRFHGNGIARRTAGPDFVDFILNIDA